MKIKTPKYKGNMEQLNPDEENELIQSLLDILEQLNWSMAYKLNTETDAIEGVICGKDEFINIVLNSISDGQDKMDVNEMFKGSKEDLN